MSDPTGRRGDNIISLLEKMKLPEIQKRGLSKSEMKNYLFRRYRFGVRDATLEGIIMQLKDRGIIHLKKIKGGIMRYFLVDPEIDLTTIFFDKEG